MCIKQRIILFCVLPIILLSTCSDIQEYAVDVGKNLSLPCPVQHNQDVMWVREGRKDQESHRTIVLEDGSLYIVNVTRYDSGVFSCSPANVAHDDLKTRIRLIVRTPPPALANVSVHPSTVLALILWGVKDNGGYPIINFTAQYKLADVEEEWTTISPSHISPNSRQIDIYKLQPNTSYAFRIWATNQLGSGEVTEVVATTLRVYQEQEQARHFLAGSEQFDTRIWIAAVAIVMGTLVILGLGTCFLLYQECRIPGVSEEQEIIELVPNIILNPGFEDSSRTEHIPADENSNNETTLRLNNNTVIQPRNM